LHLSRVEIKNFRNFNHLTLDPFPGRAVIVGENGVGKTNFSTQCGWCWIQAYLTRNAICGRKMSLKAALEASARARIR
jgi:predicted ATP-binding protein involved in virulence